MIDGPTIASDLDKTDANEALMQRYLADRLAGRRETLPRYFNGTHIQHNPRVADTTPGLIAGLQALAAKGQAVVYKSVDKILGEGNLFRIEKDRIAEHWDTLEAIPAPDQWKNSNVKF
jgi:predicted SnoaL-like aldol condensation-catalyzing enzyme